MKKHLNNDGNMLTLIGMIIGEVYSSTWPILNEMNLWKDQQDRDKFEKLFLNLGRV